MFRCAALVLATAMLSIPLAAGPARAQDSMPTSAPTPPEPVPPEPETAPPPSVEPSAEGDDDTEAHEAQYGGEEAGGALVEDDLVTRMEVFRRDTFSLQLGGMIQVQAAFYAGDEAALEFDDPADTEGFRIRRARFGLGGTLIKDWAYYLAVDLKDAVVAAQGGDQGNEILDARIEWRRFEFASVSAGVDKVPFSSFALQSSSR